MPRRGEKGNNDKSELYEGKWRGRKPAAKRSVNNASLLSTTAERKRGTSAQKKRGASWRWGMVSELEILTEEAFQRIPGTPVTEGHLKGAEKRGKKRKNLQDKDPRSERYPSMTGASLREGKKMSDKIGGDAIGNRIVVISHRNYSQQTVWSNSPGEGKKPGSELFAPLAILEEEESMSKMSMGSALPQP